MKRRLLRAVAVQFVLVTIQSGGFAANPPASDKLAEHIPSATAAESPEGQGAIERRIPFRVKDGLVSIEGKIQGERATLLVDSGSVLTTFSQEKIPTQRAASKITISMARGSVVARRQEVRFSLGESSLRDRHCDFNRSAIVGDFKFMGADGVVGLDVLTSFKSVTFDFAHSVLILQDR